MRLQGYITKKQNRALMKFKINVLRDCKKYLNMMKGKEVFLRGMKSSTHGKMGKKTVRQNREPLGMSQNVFWHFNDWLEENGHNRRDNVVIATTNLEWILRFFGSEYYIFPIGNFSYTWIEAKDVNWPDSKTGWYDGAPRLKFIKDTDDPEDLDLYKPFGDYFHTDKGIDIAHKKEYEIWFKCKAYYYLDMDKAKQNYEIVKDIIVP